MRKRGALLSPVAQVAEGAAAGWRDEASEQGEKASGLSPGSAGCLEPGCLDHTLALALVPLSKLLNLSDQGLYFFKGSSEMEIITELVS